ncbi:MAG TPA: succinate dehydrogenase, hydrophobic membrane anchor protein [Rhizomicrobium sp.]
MSVQTPLARAEGLGAAHSGTGHFWRQRVGAVALIPLSIWFVFTALTLIGSNRNEAIAFLAHPANAVAMALFIVAALHHMALGVQVVIEDYVHGEAPKIALLLINQFFAWIVGATCLFALARIAL